MFMVYFFYASCCWRAAAGLIASCAMAWLLIVVAGVAAVDVGDFVTVVVGALTAFTASDCANI